MLSVLIPTYNYNVYPLVKEVHKQLIKSGVNFEIRVYDDASTKIFEQNNLLTELSNVIFKQEKNNLGRTSLRQKIANEAIYKHLLFMDADVFPNDRFFISKILKKIENTQADVYFGGIIVPNNPPQPNRMLRWKFGKERESKPVSERNKDPYRSFICGSLVIKKNVFLEIIKPLAKLKKYGLDTYFSYLLKQKNYTIHHYHNPVTHLGFETNEEFLQKTKQAVETYHFLVKEKFLTKDYIRLTNTGEKIKVFLPLFVRKMLYKMSVPILNKNILSDNPSLFLFDFYKLLYYLQLK